jgi:acyl-CoA thioesterase-2
MQKALEELLTLLDLEELEVNLFRGESPTEDLQRVFGGQVAAQALVAASRTVQDRLVHSLHSYFLRLGDPNVPIIYQVDRIRDGRSFVTRRVTAIQHGRAIFALAASFQSHEESAEHQDEMPPAPEPESLPTFGELVERHRDRIPDYLQDWVKRDRPLDVRSTRPEEFMDYRPRSPESAMWMRTKGSLPDDPLLHQCVLTYASDMPILATAARPQGLSFHDPEVMVASLDHAMWFHRPFRFDEWMLYTHRSPSMTSSRGFTTGQLYTRDGRLAVSVTQEGLIRKRTRPAKQAR